MGAKISQPSTRKRLSSHFSKDSNSKDQSQVSKLTLDDQLPRTSSVSSREMLWFDSTQKGEQDRMNANHFALKALFEGNLSKQIDIDFTKPVKALDIGCGSGSWILDMATDYPTAQFTGIDIVPLFPQEIRPVNVNFKQEDVLTGLSFEDNTFDFVQMRLFGFQFNKLQWATSLKEAYRVTKPGGYIQLLEAQLMDPGNEIVQDFSNKLKRMMEGYDMDANVCTQLQSLLQGLGCSSVTGDTRAVPFENHILSSEFLYIIGISMEASKRFVMDMYDLRTNEEFYKLKEKYVQSRKTTSESTWWTAAGQKPLN